MDLKKIFIVGTAGFVIVCFGLFYVLTSSVSLRNSLSANQVEFSQIESKLRDLESAIVGHRKSMKEIEELAFDSVTETENKGIKDEPEFVDELSGGNKENDLISQSSCSSAFSIGLNAKSDINMLDVYEEMKFDNIDGGVWKQGWNVEIDNYRFDSQRKLKVFVIPHSHNDPGWKKTFERYFREETKSILDSMLQFMKKDPSMKFIWAEISYFNLWWNELGDDDKNSVKKLVDNKQLEFVTGGWVMPDEANSHYFSVLIQMIEGHQWLYHHLNYIPKNGWSIDPFGMSPTMAYFLKRSGLTNMLIQRTHYSVKKYLAERQNLEFKWRQNWDDSGSSDIFCHMMPFYSYDVPHTCGPDPKVCCQFDFKRMPSVSGMTCPWRIPPKPVIAKNVKERSLLLLDQYKKKAMLYKTNILLIPLGDDFRWVDMKEWEAQASNYGKIFDYINANSDLNAEVKFGTLDEYFSAVSEEVKIGRFNPLVLSGDFFTYADKDDNYWSGYFTSRPFHKAFDRELIDHLRAAHLAYTLMTSELSRKYGSITKLPFVKNLIGKLIRSRRHLSLFQHHDGVTGTSKDFVMTDYAMKLLEGVKDANFVMQQSLGLLTSEQFIPDQIHEDSIFMESTNNREEYSTLSRFNLIVLDREINKRLVTVFNPDGYKRNMLVELHVSTNNLRIFRLDGNEIDFEILPYFEEKTVVSKNIFHISFPTEIYPLTVENFWLEYSTEKKESMQSPEIKFVNAPSKIVSDDPFFSPRILEPNKEIQISNGHLKLKFNENGFLNSVIVNDKKHFVSISMNKYGARHSQETSGLYLFLPGGKSEPLQVGAPFVRIVKGKFQSYVEVWLSQIKHRVTLYNYEGFDQYSIDITNIVDIRRESNFELMMKIESDIKSQDHFYTDLNGFQMIQRKRFSKLPIQAHYYPMPTAAYIEDSELRMTVLSKQPLGAASLNSGEIEIMMDRRLMQDDNRGVDQGALDNVETLNVFKLMIEPVLCQDSEKEKKPPMLSLESQLVLHNLLYPFHSFVNPVVLEVKKFPPVYDFNQAQIGLPCDLELINAQPLPEYENAFDTNSYVAKPETGLLIRRLGFDGRFIGIIPISQCLMDSAHLGKFNQKDLFGGLLDEKMEHMTLSFIHNGKSLSNESILMRPMEVYGFLVKYLNSEVDYLPNFTQLNSV